LLTPGQKLFEYEITRLLGQGGFAAVYEASDRMLDRRVAVKQLLLDQITNERKVKRFVQEARIAAALEHPNIVTIYALRIAKKRIYIIMEYLSGGSLYDLIDQQGKLPAEQAVRLTTGICEGLAKLHAKGIIHRDIKEENILLSADGCPKITDFGIAHVPQAAGGLGLTLVGFQPSTLLYSSPEQFRGEKLDVRSDVYQVGELLYYMLTGQHYIDLAALKEKTITHANQLKVRPELELHALLEKAICEEMPEGLQSLWREVGVLGGVVEKALAKNKEDRFKDTLEFAVALNGINITSAKAETLTGRDLRTYNKLGLTHASMRNYEQAIYNYTQAIQLDSRYAEAYNNRSAVYLMMGNYAQAVLDCNWALELAPHFVAAYVNRGIAHTGLKSYQQALADYDKAIEFNANNAYAYYNQGNTYVLMGQYQEAVTAYGRAIALDPEFIAAYVNRGLMYIELDNYRLALTDYDQAIRLNPSYVEAYYNRARAHQALKNCEQAMADYSQAIKLNPDYLDAYKHRAEVYRATGEQERAAADEARVKAQTSSISPNILPIARNMSMPATPLDLLVRK
jgi:serine/threonine protein kinase